MRWTTLLPIVVGAVTATEVKRGPQPVSMSMNRFIVTDPATRMTAAKNRARSIYGKRDIEARQNESTNVELINLVSIYAVQSLSSDRFHPASGRDLYGCG